ncbi:MAG: MTH938/NDUFAF3 family protein [Desulfobulbales bacterium]|nr:MTH938/NDUFAF3 family protein [Desulfobulbales bacterium]
MPVIESYVFGKMVIDGVSYNKDVIIFPDGSILSPWWRKKGHILAKEDLVELIETGPDIIICGTGAMGVMRPAAGLLKYLATVNIQFQAQKSTKAVELYNNLSGTRKVGGCFHLTC